MEHFGRNCRVCNSSCAEYFDLQYNYGDNFAFKLTTVVPEIDLSLTLYPIICKDCAIILDEAYLLRLRCLQTQATLYNALRSPPFKNSTEPNITIENDVNAVINGCCKIEINDNQITTQNSPEQELIFELRENFVCDNTIHSPEKELNLELCGNSVCNNTKNYPEKELKLELCENFVCDKCTKEFHSIDKFDMHKCGKIKQAPFKCPFCEQAFETRRQLNLHRRVHKDLKSFSCDKCTKCFKTRQQLQTHMNIHDDKKLFLCNDCSKGFSTKGNLMVHVRIHTGEKPFACAKCNKKFTTKGNMQHHLRRKHNL